MGKRRNRFQHRTGQGSSGNIASWGQGALQSYRVGALPIINHLFELSTTQLFAVNDDRAARWLTKFFAWDPPTIALAVTTHCLREFHVNLDELHNDSTTVTFYGDYAAAEREHACHGRRTPAITFGHKDHRPDLKQILYVLTISKDGGVPVHFRVHSGNVVDDQTHRETRDLLRQLAGRTDFLYVADCKLATRENMAYIAGHHGRFVSILPRTRKEDAEFREQLAAGRITWQLLWEKKGRTRTAAGCLLPLRRAHLDLGRLPPALVSQQGQGPPGRRDSGDQYPPRPSGPGPLARQAAQSADAVSRADQDSGGGRGDSK